MFSKFDAYGPVPSLLDAVRRHTTHLALVGGQDLPTWLPTLAHPPTGWLIGCLDAGIGPTRMLLRRNKTGDYWGGCAILNIYALTGRVPTEVIEAEAASTLRAIGEAYLGSRPIAIPARDGLQVTAASAVGEFALGGRRLQGQYTAYLVQTEDEATAMFRGRETARGALVEHNVFLADHTNTRMQHELIDMDYAVLNAVRAAVS